MTTNDARATGPVLVARGAAFSYGAHPALGGVDLTLEPGTATALIGPNGAGKSTLLKGILGLVRLTAGELHAPSVTGRARSIGYLPQSGQVDPDFPITARQVVMLGRSRQLPWYRWPNRADRAAVAAALETVGLQDRARRRFGDLSGGQRQRVLLARAIVSEPRLLLLDEPFNGLDAENREALLATLGRLRAAGVALLVSTHDLVLARAVCDRVLALADGRVVAHGPLAEVLGPDSATERLLGGDHGDG